ncbi:uncharacterized protein F5891DRAFT_1187070 [Suillus fuscotomentosus]|uniref:Uncharacterized protein n=1 Tax=Suillus fuscotomentosus TaxID=1912939 RepID=A0AAD4E964_9AGAM|nr:uncharacterized protein F5891DRAFT_1187070 [Suillus fuscotomentosus]KAG1902035.1 hypothetical protein F5891DRAFT_1187070 [Suillus fuscotomentosus]
MLAPSSSLVCFIFLVRSEEGCYGLRARPTGGALQLLSLRKRLIDFLRISQRKALAPAFNNAGIRKLIPLFYDSVYNAKGVWNIAIESSKDGNATIEVQN